MLKHGSAGPQGVKAIARDLCMTRTLGLIAVIGVLAWLAIEPPPRQAAWAALQQAFDRGDLGHLPQQQADALRRTITWLAPFAQVTGSIAVNERPRPGRLNIITTTERALAVTGCARGNAIYDAALDSVFIDEQIVLARDLPLIGEAGPRSMYTPELLGFPIVYLRFVLLHELGHRYRHRGSGGFFDARHGERVEEAAADLFAVRSLTAAYSADLAQGGVHLSRGAAASLQLSPATIPVAERVWVDLLGAAASMSVSLMYSAGLFSSFYQDAAHPTFLDRATRLFSLALSSGEVSPTLKAHAVFYLENLARIKDLLARSVTELQLPLSVQNVAFDRGRLLVLTDHGHLYAAPLEGMKPQGFRELPVTARIAVGPYADPDDVSWSSPLWVFRDAGPIVLREKPPGATKEMEAVRPDGTGRFTAAATLSAISNTSSFGDAAAIQGQPCERTILGTMTRDRGDYRILQADGVRAEGHWERVRDQIRTALGLPKAEIELGTVTDQAAYLSVLDSSGAADGHEQLRGSAVLDLLHNTVSDVRLLDFRSPGGGETPTVEGDRLVAVPSADAHGARFFLLTRNLSQFLVFEVFGDRPMQLIGRHPFILDHLNRQSSGSLQSTLVAAFDPILANAYWVPSRGLVAVFRNDSVYSVDPGSGQIRLIFNPGSEVRIAVSTDGRVALYARNGYKVYLL